MGEELIQMLTAERTLGIVRAALLAAVGWTLAVILSRLVRRAGKDRLSPHHMQLAHRGVLYTVLALFTASALRELGFSLAVLMGAAGVLTVAIGFASQTSASNLISGFFLIGERPFEVGDVVQVGATTGEVLSIDALSVKLRTFDNLFVRIPNETLIKSEVTTLTRFAIRRLDIKVGVAYKENIGNVRQVLMQVCEKNPLCMDNPPPLFIFLGFGDSSLHIQLSVWATREKFLDLRNTIHEEIKAAFDESLIEIPFPHRSLYAGEATKPFPIRVVSADEVEIEVATQATPDAATARAGETPAA